MDTDKTLFLRINNKEIRENKNHMYHVLAAIIDQKQNIERESYFTLRDIYDFLKLSYRKKYSIFKYLIDTIDYMEATNKITITKGPDINNADFNDCIEIIIHPDNFYGNSFSMLSRNTFKKIAIINSDISKDKLFHVLLYYNSFQKFYATTETIASTLGISKNTITKCFKILNEENII